MASYLRETNADGGAVGFLVGPGRGRGGPTPGSFFGRNEGRLLELALIAAEYGRTTLIDGRGGAVVFGSALAGADDRNIELF